METAVITEKRKSGNPNWVKKEPSTRKDEFDIDPQKRYRFQLIETYEKLKPVDSKTGTVGDNLYPPIKMVPNAGVAFHNGEMRRWRYVYGYPTIWVDEQDTPEPSMQQLIDQRNDLNFREGNLFVQGADKAKMMALLIQDEYEGQKNPVNNLPKTFRLINETDALNVQAQAADKAFEAESAARNASIDELLPIALLFGINIDNHIEREELIKKEVILKARQLPDAFLQNYVSPKTKIKYLVTKAITQNIISGSTGQIVMVDTGKILFDIDINRDIAEQVSSLVMANDEQASLLYTQLQKVLS